MEEKTTEYIIEPEEEKRTKPPKRPQPAKVNKFDFVKMLPIIFAMASFFFTFLNSFLMIIVNANYSLVAYGILFAFAFGLAFAAMIISIFRHKEKFVFNTEVAICFISLVISLAVIIV